MPDPNYASQFNSGDISFVLVCMALVWLMIPGVGYFYSGMARSKNALSLIMCCVLSLVVVTVQVQYSSHPAQFESRFYWFSFDDVVVYLGLQFDV